jgi:hypothetical protein
MLWNLDAFWLMMAIGIVSVVAFMFGHALHALMDDDGFGPYGNMIIITTGFFIAILAANYQGVKFHDLKLASIVGLAGSFLSLASLALLKAGLQRI